MLLMLTRIALLTLLNANRFDANTANAHTTKVKTTNANPANANTTTVYSTNGNSTNANGPVNTINDK